MKTNKLLAGLLLIGGLFTMNGQDVASTATLTSGGYGAGTNGNSCVFYGYLAGAGAPLSPPLTYYNTFIGNRAGKAIAANGNGNTFLGFDAGLGNTTGGYNVFLGQSSGLNNISGTTNIFIGSYAGSGNTTGSNNVRIGGGMGGTTTGQFNSSLGAAAGTAGAGSFNTCLGAGSGSTSGSRNVFIGYSVGTTTTVNDKLYIDNTTTTTPLIWGDFSTDQLKLNGQVGIGGVTTFPNAVGGVNTSTYKLFVQGGVLATEVRVATTWADYVFEDNYALPSLDEVECFIDENGHLPNVPSAKQVAEEGISVGEMAKIQQEKIEELTLYIIAQDKQLKEQQLKVEKLEKMEQELNDLKVLIQGLSAKK